MGWPVLLLALTPASFAAVDPPVTSAPTVPARRPDQPGVDRPAMATMPTLLVGDRAPDLIVQRWVQGGPIEGLGAGKVWIVEFWATWCTPCAASIPRLSELQARFGDQGLTVIGVASQEVSGADVDRYVRASRDKLTYAVALDSNGATHQRWMAAAGQDSIPTAFLIDRQGRIAWIGHPLEGLEDATTRLIEGRFDMAAATAAYKQRVMLMSRAQPIIARFREHLDAGEHQQAIAAAEELIALDGSAFGAYAFMKFQVMATGLKDYAAAYRYAGESIDGVLRENADGLASLAVMICDDPRLDRRDFKVAQRAAARANDLTGGRRYDVLAALARAALEAGQLDRAVEFQASAAEAAPPGASRSEMERRLAEYRSRLSKNPPK